jgi:hypothetical protein
MRRSRLLIDDGSLYQADGNAAEGPVLRICKALATTIHPSLNL